MKFLPFRMASCSLALPWPRSFSAGRPSPELGSWKGGAIAGGSGTPLPPGHPPIQRRRRTGKQLPSDLLKKLDATPGLKTRQKSFEIAAALESCYFRAAASWTRRSSSSRPRQGGAPRGRCSTSRPTRRLGPEDGAPSARGDAAARPSETPLREDLRDRRAAGQRRATPRGRRSARGLRSGRRSMVARHARLRLGCSGPRRARMAATRSCWRWTPDALLRPGRGAPGDARARPEGAQAGAPGLRVRILAVAPRHPQAVDAREARAVDASGHRRGRRHLARGRAEERKVRPTRLRRRSPCPSRQAARAGRPPRARRPLASPRRRVDAVQNTERTPELDAGLAKLVEEGEEHLAHGPLPGGAGRLQARDALHGRKRSVAGGDGVGAGGPTSSPWRTASGQWPWRRSRGGGQARGHAQGQGQRAERRPVAAAARSAPAPGPPASPRSCRNSGAPESSLSPWERVGVRDAKLS